MGYERRRTQRSCLADFNEAIKLEPDNAEYILARGELWQTLENYEAALRDFGEFRVFVTRRSRASRSRVRTRIRCSRFR